MEERKPSVNSKAKGKEWRWVDESEDLVAKITDGNFLRFQSSVTFTTCAKLIGHNRLSKYFGMWNDYPFNISRSILA